MKTVFPPAGHWFVFFFVIAFALIHGIRVYAESIPGRTFTSANRLIKNMACDDHFIWGGTCGEGLIRIDKVTGETSMHSFSNPGLPRNCIRALAFDTNGALLAGTANEGIVRFDGSKWERVPALSDTIVRGMLVDSQGKIWAWMQNSGVLRYDSNAWQPIVNLSTGVLANGPNGSVWIMNLPTNGDSGCGDAWIHEYVNGGLQSSVSLKSICPERFYQQSLVVDTKKNCWIGVTNKLIKVTGQTIQTFTANTDTACRTYCSALAVNRNDVLLIATQTYVSGLFAATKIFLYDQRNGTPFDSAVLTYSDRYIDAVGCADEREGCFWLAASNGSIVRIDTSRVSTAFPTGNSVLPGNSIASLLIDKADNVWAATNNGIARCNDTSWTVYPAPGDSFPGNDACCLATDSSGTIWAGFRQPLVSSMSSTGLSYFSGQQWRMLFRSHFSQKALAADKTGDLWAAAEDGVYRYHEMKGEKLYVISGTGFDTSMNAIAIDGDNIPWIGIDQGLKKYENNFWIDDTAFSLLFPKSEGAGARLTAEVTAICFHDNTAWIGTAGGLFKRIGNNFTRIDTAGGLLPDPYVQCIAPDDANGAWVGTRRGLARLNGQHHATYTSENTPLCDNDITACAVGRSGDVWIGTRQGGLTVLRGAAITTAINIVPTRNRGLQLIDISCGAMRHGAFRISIRTNSPAAIGLSVISLQGELVRRFDAMPAKAQSVEFTWDGTDCYNRPVSAGVYLGVVTANGKLVGSKIIRR